MCPVKDLQLLVFMALKEEGSNTLMQSEFIFKGKIASLINESQADRVERVDIKPFTHGSFECVPVYHYYRIAFLMRSTRGSRCTPIAALSRN
jgi:hypothetical protein